jgi:hypothetical protein
VCGFIPTAGSNPALSAKPLLDHKPLLAGVCCFNYFLSPSDLKTPVTVSDTESNADVKVEQPDKLKAVKTTKVMESDLNTCDMEILMAELNESHAS